MKVKIARRSSRPTNNPITEVKRARRVAVLPTKPVKVVRNLMVGDLTSERTQPTSFLTHSLQLRAQNLGRAGR